MEDAEDVQVVIAVVAAAVEEVEQGQTEVPVLQVQLEQVQIIAQVLEQILEYVV